MRIAGHVFLIIGLLLCVSIAWAAIGFFAMGFGLIFLLIAEEQLKASALRSRRPETQFRSIRVDRPPKATTLDATQVWPAQTSLLADNPNQIDEWESLVRKDQDLSQVVTILMPFGQKYVEQLAKAYVAFNDKAFLPMILDMVVASARKDSDLRPFDAFANPYDQSSAPCSQPDSLREIASLAIFKRPSDKGSSEDGRNPREIAEATIQPKSMSSSVILRQHAPLSGSGQGSENPVRDDDVTAEADFVEPSVREIDRVESDSLKRLFDLLVLLPAKGKEN
ncbi:hypothetical protein UP10_41955 [Bradyrhizobium sp. LTSPM299]|uniref:hypothetical protein n=1 Tax=Bradyrhizobium sp. LTSPM299 TaxID=1619233 RepID=UPI0005C9BC1C|nr:hypothetical protein [Bradyrhizobium sp. LTSPM299]KJC53651.1 hypothetical protein UP10_41955 [Bradyrhizobium sp. LTSPM299]